MAKEAMGYIPKEVKKAAYWTAENSIWVSGPLLAANVASGGLPLAVGGTLFAIDVFMSHEAGKRRRALG